MPHSNEKQPIAAFLNIKKQQGLSAARSFARKHRGDMARGAKVVHGKRPYKARKSRSD